MIKYTPPFRTLLSYHYFKTKNLTERLRDTFVEQPEIFMDSGAFTALTQGEPISLSEYAAHLKKHGDVVSWYANLDVIGDAKQTWQNQKRMERGGCHRYLYSM